MAPHLANTLNSGHYITVSVTCLGNVVTFCAQRKHSGNYSYCKRTCTQSSSQICSGNLFHYRLKPLLSAPTASPTIQHHALVAVVLHNYLHLERHNSYSILLVYLKKQYFMFEEPTPVLRYTAATSLYNLSNIYVQRI